MKSVLSRVLVKNGVQLLDTIYKEHVPCDDSLIKGIYWLVPTILNGILYEYKPVIAVPGAAKPTIDSVKALKVFNTASGYTYMVALEDAAIAQAFTDKCALCCGADPVEMPDVSVPRVYPEETGKLNEDGEFEYLIVPAPVGAGGVKVYGSKNGVALTPETPASFASVAAFATWAAANWAAHGTFTVAAGKVTWTSATAKTGSLVFNTL